MSTHRAPRVLQRVVFPGGESLDVLPLYVETDMGRGAASSGPSGEAPPTNAVVAGSQTSIRFTDLPVDALPRRSALLTGGRRTSFATYFNAFPAGYWRRWSTVSEITLRVRMSGDATVVVYRSNAKGRSHPVHTVTFEGDEARTVTVPLTLTPFIDGGWYWFDIAAGQGGATLVEADWATTTEDADAGRVSIGITTFNRPDFVVELLESIGAADDLLDALDAVYLIDQGDAHPDEREEFADATKALGSRLHVIRQPNLGGSGGFSRAMSETVTAGASDYVLLLDDDIVLEAEGVLRAVAFADLARRPTIVGGHMFSLHERAVLNAFGETVSPHKWWWGPAAQTQRDHDFGRQGLRHTPWLHRRTDVDYNGWWMCLIPVSIVAELGLSLPVFIKWDDAEYGLRARAAGYPTVSLPGVAVWHVPWHDKNDSVDWQAYYHVRNRVITALLHSPYERGGRVVAESMEVQIQHLLSMQYSTAALRILALQDLLEGPSALHDQILGKNAELRALAGTYVDARLAPDVEAFPSVRRRRLPAHDKQTRAPRNPVELVVRAGLGAVRQLLPTTRAAAERPEVALANQDAVWWALSNVDGAVVSSADGATAAWYQRQPSEFRSLLARSASLHARLLREWPRLAPVYRQALPDITSPARWQETFGAD